MHALKPAGINKPLWPKKLDSAPPRTVQNRYYQVCRINEVIMPKRENLGEFEQVVLLTLVRLKDQAYGRAIRQEIADRTGRDVGIGSIYSTLDRLEEKGHISSTLGDPTPKRGGRAKRYYRLERSGFLALKRMQEMYARLWDGLLHDQETFQ